MFSISTCRERTPRWYKRWELDHLGLLGGPAPDGLVLEDERILDGVVVVFAWKIVT